MRLKNIAQVIHGYTFRGSIKPENNGNVLVFQAKDLIQSKPVTSIESLARIMLLTKGYAGYLRKHDVLLVARGMKSGAFRSTIFMSDVREVIPSSSVLVVRMTNEGVLPEYVSHYLNSDKGQSDLSEIVSGSYIGAILRKDLEDIEIPVPSMQKQKIIVNLYHNIQEQQKLSTVKLKSRVILLIHYLERWQRYEKRS